jgi:hypothetical protein
VDVEVADHDGWDSGVEGGEEECGEAMARVGNIMVDGEEAEGLATGRREPNKEGGRGSEGVGEERDDAKGVEEGFVDINECCGNGIA